MDIEIAFGSLQVLVDKCGTSFSKGALDTIRKKYAEAVEQPLTGDKTSKTSPKGDITPNCNTCVHVKVGCMKIVTSKGYCAEYKPA